MVVFDDGSVGELREVLVGEDGPQRFDIVFVIRFEGPRQFLTIDHGVWRLRQVSEEPTASRRREEVEGPVH